MVTDSEGNFDFRLYVHVPIGIHRTQLFEKTDLETSLVPQSSTSVKAQFLLGVIGLTSLPFMLQSKKVGNVYNPQRVMHQFGYDQGVVILSGDSFVPSAVVT